MMRSVRRGALAVLLVGLGGRLAASDETAAPSDASLQQTLRLLRDQGFAVDAPVATKQAIEGLVQALDPRGRLFDAAEWKTFEARQTGLTPRLGLETSVTNGLVVIRSVLPDSPADRAGLKPGEGLEEVNGQYAREMTEAQLARAFAGPEGSLVKLAVAEPGKPPRRVEIARAPLPVPPVAQQEIFPRRIGYVRLHGLYAGSGPAVLDALQKAMGGKPSGGGILDLRGAGGQDEEAVAAVAALFTGPNVPLYAFADRGGGDEAVHLSGPAEGPGPAVPVMVLIDRETRGAAELLAAVLAWHARRTMSIGEETEGDPLVRRPLALPDGRHALLAHRVLRVGEARYDGTAGVKPYLAIKATSEAAESAYEPETLERNGTKVLDAEKEDRALRQRVNGDPFLQRAVDILRGLQALRKD